MFLFSPPFFVSLTGFFEARFGAKGSEGFRRAQRRFIESLAAYSIACYLLQIKDRWVGGSVGSLAGVWDFGLPSRVPKSPYFVA